MRRSPFHRKNATLRVAAANGEAEVVLYDEIGFWGITAEDFKKQIDDIKAKTIHLRINSPGGDVFDGLAIHNALREHDAKVITHIDGVAASMASVVAMAGDEILMADNAFMMLHEPWSLAMGNAEDLRKEADLLEKVSGSLHSVYEARTGADAEQVSTWMTDETWLTAAEAKTAGFVDEITTGEEGKARDIAATFDLSVFNHLPDELQEDEEREPTMRDLERALRDAGLSQIAAKQYISAGREAATHRDGEEAGERDVTPEPVKSFKPMFVT